MTYCRKFFLLCSTFGIVLHQLALHFELGKNTIISTMHKIGNLACCSFLGDRVPPQYCHQSEGESHSKTSLNDLDIAGRVQDIGEAAKQKVVVTGPLISAVLVAILLQLLVGYNIGVMVRNMMQLSTVRPCFTSIFYFIFTSKGLLWGGGGYLNIFQFSSF